MGYRGDFDLKNLKYSFFSTNEIKPAGWLKEQLTVQANGLCGNLDKVWKDVRDSAWIGGDCEGWERVPYWLDGFIPMAYLLEDDDLIGRGKKYIDAIIKLQSEDGWICPCSLDERANYDTWAVLLIAKVLSVYGDCSKDPRVVKVLYKCLKNFDSHLNFHTLRDWGAARWFEGLIPILWLYEKKPEDWLINLAKKLNVEGFDWKNIFESGYIDTLTCGWDYYSHVVNVAMMLKCEALANVFGFDGYEGFTKKALEYLGANHGTAAGHFNGDECLSGLSPVNGTELCGVVEAMYSYEWNFAVSGDTEWLDRLEKLAYNALPATISPDMWSHQYVQMTNQVAAFPMSKQPFRNNNNVAHTFGLEPNFGCCTSNFGQGWPKFTLSTFMKTEDGIASCAIAPSVLKTEISGVRVVCELETGYPFRNSLVYKIQTEAPVDFNFSVRIPKCVKSAKVCGENAECGKFYEINKKWDGSNTVTVELDFETEVVKRPADMVCVWRGPLMYSVGIKENWEKVEYEKDGVERKFPYCDYYIYPESKWNYALASDKFEVRENHGYSKGFSGDAPVEMTAYMYELEWGFKNGHCDPEPKTRLPLGEMQKVRLIPYGCSNLRMTEIPYIKK